MWLTQVLTSHQKLIDDSINENCFVTVVIPVRNEAEHISLTIKSLMAQVDLQNRPLDPSWYEVIFFVNNSSDNSAEIIRRECADLSHFHLAVKTLPAENSNIGYVRRLLMNEAFLRLRNNKSGRGIIATTDGDTVVAPNWIASIAAEIKKGADAVGGRILIKPSELLQMDQGCRAFHLRDAGYRLMTAELESYLDRIEHDSLPRHHQHFNGSFAVTTEALQKAGGIPEVRCLEDVAFYNALLSTDAKFRHSPHVRVQTSARREGRTELGLSTQLNEWTIMSCYNDEYLVESAEAIKMRFEARRSLRRLWDLRDRDLHFSLDDLNKIADVLKISAGFLRDELEILQPFGKLYDNAINQQHSIGEWNRKYPLNKVEKAIYDLRLLLEKFRRTGKIV